MLSLKETKKIYRGEFALLLIIAINSLSVVLAAFTMGKVIGKISDWIGKHMSFTSFLEH